MIRCFIFIVLGVTMISCKDKVNLDNLINKKSFYFQDSNDSKPFSGIAIGKETRRGVEYTLSSYTFKEGIPSGKWTTYGYAREILQEGNFIPVLDITEIKNLFPDLIRINIDRYKEGTDEEMIGVILISNNPSKDSIKYEANKDSLIKFLRKNKFLDQSELEIPERVIVSDGEF